VDVACCSAEALGLLLGWSWDEILALYWRTASDPDAGASILDTLRVVGQPAICASAVRIDSDQAARVSASTYGHGLILGVTLPEPHAIAVTPDGTWWSWGEPFNPAGWPELVIEEAWCLP